MTVKGSLFKKKRAPVTDQVRGIEEKKMKVSSLFALLDLQLFKMVAHPVFCFSQGKGAGIK